MKIRDHVSLGTTLLLFAIAVAGCGRGGPSESSVEAVSGIRWKTDYTAALQQARSSEKLVVIDFFATWCGPCKMMDRNTFTDSQVQSSLAEFVPLKIDVDRQPEVASRYGIEALPTTVVVDSTGKQVTKAVGYLDPKSFLAVLNAANSGGERTGSAE